MFHGCTLMLSIFLCALVGFILIVALKHCWQDVQQYERNGLLCFCDYVNMPQCHVISTLPILFPLLGHCHPTITYRRWCHILTHTEATLHVPSKSVFTLKEVFFLGSLVAHGRCSVASSFRLLASDPFQFSTYSDILTLYNLSADSTIQQSTNEYMLAICGTIVSLVLNWGPFSFYLVVVSDINFDIINEYKVITLFKVFTEILLEEEFCDVTLHNHNLAKNHDLL
jgi:hypothetical protein